tara:strand:+ start:350 stop:736 length:387 start_codon:yes stop_codon:yes gene_type:complete
MDGLSAALTELGALGLFCAYLVWSHREMQRRLDRLSEEWTTSLEKVEAEHRDAEEVIRNRYDVILERYEATRENIYKDVVKTLDKNNKLLRDVGVRVDEIRRARLGLSPTETDEQLLTWVDDPTDKKK